MLHFFFDINIIFIIIFNMNYNEINSKLEQLNMEDRIWIVYIGIILLSWYSNSIERK